MMTIINRQEGFTVTELLVVVILIGVLGTMATVSISSYNRRVAVKEVARAVDADLMELRTTARVRQRSLVVRFETATDYRAFYDNNEDELYTAGTDTQIRFRTFNSGPVQIQVVGQALPFSVRFNNIGNIDSGTTTELIASVPTLPNRRYCVRLFPTGITRVVFTESAAVVPPCDTWQRAW